MGLRCSAQRRPRRARQPRRAHLADGEAHALRDELKAERVVRRWAHVPENELHQAHQRDLLLEEGGVRDERGLRLELRAVCGDELLVELDVARVENAEELGEPRVLRRLELRHHRVLQQLAKVVDGFGDERREPEVKRERDRVRRGHLLERLVRQQQQRGLVELARRTLQLRARRGHGAARARQRAAWRGARGARARAA